MYDSRVISFPTCKTFATMPKFIACPICNKTGMSRTAEGKMQRCPVCINGSASIGQIGWTTATTLNAYYRHLALQKANPRIELQMQIYMISNPSASNRQVKQRRAIIENMIMTQELKAFPLVAE
jgi:hypothetical protein